MKLKIKINERCFKATLSQNKAVDALVTMLKQAPITISMSDYGGFEKVGALKNNLPAQDKYTATVAGDIVLYNSNQIVIFYGSNSWSYTRLAKVDNLDGWKEALGHGNITAIFSLDD
ncbi:cyclophilin-like fold protein [uncultured Thomasclavelia sp.]|uniref:cyclophilin-like fold protein n=1 Tax=uncultured Thomasclavelia sp. TaxID=3025759 RepID=UPI0025E29E24|nr:cyclophilin-like fold protein [uncultured Thomasclavelia sp.]